VRRKRAQVWWVFNGFRMTWLTKERRALLRNYTTDRCYCDQRRWVRGAAMKSKIASERICLCPCVETISANRRIWKTGFVRSWAGRRAAKSASNERKEPADISPPLDLSRAFCHDYKYKYKYKYLLTLLRPKGRTTW